VRYSISEEIIDILYRQWFYKRVQKH